MSLTAICAIRVLKPALTALAVLARASFGGAQETKTNKTFIDYFSTTPIVGFLTTRPAAGRELTETMTIGAFMKRVIPSLIRARSNTVGDGARSLFCRKKLLFQGLFCLSLLLARTLEAAPAQLRQSININREWKFQLGDVSGAEAAAFNDASWHDTNLPHSFSMPYFAADRFYVGYGWYRKHFNVQKDWLGKRVNLEFDGVFQVAEVFVNGRRIGESHDWSAQPVFDIKNALHSGDNVIAVGVKNDGGSGGMSPEVSVEIIGKAEAQPWSRSLFNGLAQVIVQSTKDAGEIKLTATADGLAPATSAVQTQPCAPRPSVP